MAWIWSSIRRALFSALMTDDFRMKNRIFQVLAACVALFFLNSCDSAIPFESLPQNARDFITSNFPGVTVPFAKADFLEYEVRLMDGSEIEFGKDGELKKMDMEDSIIPSAVYAELPEGIGSYLESTFPGIPAEKLERTIFGSYKIELVNDVELKFNSKGVLKSCSF